MKALIINHNRLTLPKNMADYLSNCGITPVIIDNNSTYQPLLDFYNTTEYEVIRLNHNYGHTVVWDANILRQLNIDDEYIISDSDLDLSEIPVDFVNILQEGLKKYPQYDKCGFSLDIHDLPDCKLKKFIIRTERGYWENPLDEMYFDAPLDTTFALYKKGVKHKTFNSLRTNKPYCAKHVPWYYTDMNNLPEDEIYFYSQFKSYLNQTSTFYTKEMIIN